MVGQRVEDWLVEVSHQFPLLFSGAAIVGCGTYSGTCHWVGKSTCQDWTAIARSLTSMLFAAFSIVLCGCCSGFCTDKCQHVDSRRV
jgi:hypothetical protein